MNPSASRSPWPTDKGAFMPPTLEVLFISDEVITGFCRTGRWFALSHWNVKPDIMSFAKGVTSGYLPLGGIMLSRAFMDEFDLHPRPGGGTEVRLAKGLP